MKPKPTSPEAKALAELLDVLEPVFKLAPKPESKAAPITPKRKPTPKQNALDLD